VPYSIRRRRPVCAIEGEAVLATTDNYLEEIGMRTPLLLPPASLKLSTGARIALQLPGSIQGTVIDDAGMAVSKALVYAFPEQVTSKQIQTTADQQGRFVFKGLPTGRVYLGAFRKSDAFTVTSSHSLSTPSKTSAREKSKREECYL